MEKSKELSQNFMLITEDITHQEDTHAALLQSEKLSLTGRLAASLAHEINNPLQTSLGCLGLVEEMLDDCDKDLSVYINLAIDELQRSARIVKKLRDLNRTTDISERGPVDIVQLINGVMILTKNRLIDRNIDADFPYQGPPPIIYASNDLIQQVILNLFMNAIDALPNGGRIFIDLVPSSNPKGVFVHIRDTGVGIDPEVQKNIFDPFFTTKDDGLGLGLYLCKNIIEDHAGSLTFTSEYGEGTEFIIWLPGYDPALEKEQ
jgi:two-component system sporulation sensor kinase A